MDRLGSWGPAAVGAMLLLVACGDGAETSPTADGASVASPAPRAAASDARRGSAPESSSTSTVEISPSEDPTPSETVTLPSTVSSDPSDAAPPLLGTQWVLTSALLDGEPVDVSSPDGPPRWGFVARGDDGPMLVGSDGCNSISWKVTIDDEAVTFDELGESTAEECSGALADVMDMVFGAGSMGYEIDGDQLLGRAGTMTRDVALIFTALDSSDDPFPPTEATIVDQGQEGDIAYRLAWLQGWLGLEVLDVNLPVVPSGGGFGMVMSPVYAERHDLGGRPYLVARMPADVARAVYEPVGGPAIEVELHEVSEPAALVVGEFIDDAAPQWSLVTYDAGGDELHRFLWPDVRVVTAAD